MMYGDADPVPVDAQITSGGRTKPMEQFKASMDAMFHNDQTTSRLYQRIEAYEIALGELKDETGIVLELPQKELMASARKGSETGATTALAFNFEAQHWYDEQFEKLRTERPDIADKIPNKDSLHAIMSREAQRREARNADLNSRAGFGAKAAGFGGSLVGAMSDPLNVMTLPIGGASKTVLGATAKGAAVNAGVEAGIQPFVQSSRADLGLDAGFSQGLSNVGFAAIGGAAFGGAAKGLEIGISKLGPDNGQILASEFRSMVDSADLSGVNVGGRQALVQAYAASPDRQTPLGNQLRDAVETDLAMSDKSPIGTKPAARAEHERAIASAIENPDKVLIPQSPVTAAQLPETMAFFRPDELNVDAKRFQFKSGGDKDGVTDALSGVTQWDPARSGRIMVWRDSAGTNWVADGHQRSGLARRLKAENPGQDIRLLADTLDAADGVTSEMARAIAAMKNISQGTGTAIDAGKVLRDYPELLDGSVRMTSTYIKTARGLASLDDDAFLMVVNGVIPENYGAIVGRRVPPELQPSIVQLLGQTSPENAFQAEAIVSQALATGTKREVTASLFGDQEIVTSLFKERAKVLDGAIRDLRRNAAVFRTLVKEDAKITGAGNNRLDKNVNKQKVDDNAQAEEIIRRLANSTGDISTALGRAAERYAGGQSLKGAIRDFVRDVQRTRSEDGLGAAAGGGAAPVRAGSENPAGDANLIPAESAEPAAAALTTISDDSAEALTRQSQALEADLFGEPDAVRAPIPVGEKLDGDDRVADVMSADDADALIKSDDDMLARLKGCVDE